MHTSKAMMLVPALLAALNCSPRGAGSAHPPPPHARVMENVFVSDELPKLKLTLDPAFQYLGSFPFDIFGVAGGYRYVWGIIDHDKHLRTTFVIQAEGCYPDNDKSYSWGTPRPVVMGGETWQHGVWIYDNDESARERPGNESDLTRKFLHERGYTWEPQLVMSRFARIVDASKKNEIIFFYFDNLRPHTDKPLKEFPEEPVTDEHKKILQDVDEAARKAFQLE